MGHSSFVILLLFLTPATAADPVPAGAPWPADEVALTNGARFRGLILKEDARGVEFQVVRRQPGRPTITLTTFFPAREVADVKRLGAAERAALKEKLAELDPTGDGERRQMEALELAPADWLGTPGAAREYHSDQFVLVSGAPEEVTRRAAVRLEQIYAAFARVLPPRYPAGRPTTVLLAGDMKDYAKLVGPTAGPVLNPAVYDPAANRIVCGSDLRRLGEELTAIHRKHAEELARLDRYEAELRQLYKGQKADLSRFLEGSARERRRVLSAERANTRAFDKATHRLFAILYHEASHSYVATFVYPPLAAADVRAGKGTGELPRWLNEGLAQVFETAVVEAGELRVGLPDPERLEKAQGLTRGRAGLLPLGELLRAGRETFLAAHAAERAAADRAYLTSWAATCYLTFERRLLGTKEFEAYLAAVNSGGDPVKAFEAWVGQDLPAFEKELREYVTRLRPDGTAGKKP